MAFMTRYNCFIWFDIALETFPTEKLCSMLRSCAVHVVLCVLFDAGWFRSRDDCFAQVRFSFRECIWRCLLSPIILLILAHVCLSQNYSIFEMYHSNVYHFAAIKKFWIYLSELYAVHGTSSRRWSCAAFTYCRQKIAFPSLNSKLMILLQTLPYIVWFVTIEHLSKIIKRMRGSWTVSIFCILARFPHSTTQIFIRKLADGFTSKYDMVS